jgi:acetate kinase
MRALVFNCGSSSLKLELVELDERFARRRTVARGKVEQIGEDSAYSFRGPDGCAVEARKSFSDHASAALFALQWLGSAAGTLAGGLDAVGYRVVHGGEEISGPRVIDERVMQALEGASRFAPLHNPPAISVIRTVTAQLPSTPAVVLADTAFHATLAPEARTYAIPRELAQRHGIRRFGFHGLGHAWMLERYAELTGRAIETLNLVTMHLGAGCSATAIRAGRSVDTSMGLTPLEGLVMATRSGDLDPAIVTYLAANEGIAPDEIERILNHKSGMLGVSALSDDLRELKRAADSGNADAALAIDVFCHRARKYVGAYAALVGQPDAIIFGGGIGENADWIRARILSGLEWLGIEIDPAHNRNAVGREGRISSDASRIAVHVLPLDEELYIARAALRLVSGPARG